MTTNEGRAAVEEAISFLETASAESAMTWNVGLEQAAQYHTSDMIATAGFGHTSSNGWSMSQRFEHFGDWSYTLGENMAAAQYQYIDGTEIIAQLLIDDGVPSRGHRENLFNPAFATTAVACGEHPTYAMICTITYAGAFTAHSP